jgi:hypothetical protein
MAEISITHTGHRMETHMRGRVFRFAKKRARGQRISTKEMRRICVLDGAAGHALEHWGITQPCHGPTCNHGHQTREAIERLVASGVLRWVGKGCNVAAYTQGREWRPAPSDHHTVMQFV